MVAFYTKAFGWKTQALGPEMGNYVTVQTAETDKNGMVKEPGRINGGFAAKSKDFQSINLVIAVDDIRQAMKTVKAAGGNVVDGQKPGEPDEIPGIGLYVSIIDTEGNRVGMLQPKSMGAAG
jgi:predicted enzyme related to lactoylglutathione lyase